MKWTEALSLAVSAMAVGVATLSWIRARRAVNEVRKERQARDALERRLSSWDTWSPPPPDSGLADAHPPGVRYPDEGAGAGAVPPVAPPAPASGAGSPDAAVPPPSSPAFRRPDAEDRWLRLRFSEPATGAAVSFPYLAPGQSIDLSVSIGRDAPGYLPADVPFPRELLPDRDLRLTVVVSSSDFGISMLGGESRVTATGVIELEAASGTSTEMHLTLTAPNEVGVGHLRVSVFFHGALVQSVVVSMTVDELGVTHVFNAVADYTATQTLNELPLITERHRFAVLTNDNADESHQILIRHDNGLAGPTTTFAIREDAVAPLIAELREELAQASPRTLPAREGELRESLRRLAPVGARLYTSLFAPAREVLLALDGEDPSTVTVQVARPRSAAFTYPWNFLYSIPLDRDVSVDDLPFCPVVDELAAGGAQLPQLGGRCPHEAAVPHDQLLCPFGFWGIRYQIELPPSRAAVTLDVCTPDAAVLAVGLTDRDVDARALAQHVETLRAIWEGSHPGVTLASSGEKEKLLSLMETDQPLVYLCCHGDADGAEVVLGLGGRDRLYTDDLVTLVRRVQQRGSRLWATCAPLVFLNCCGSLAIEPKTLVSYVDSFVGSAQASGVIGTGARISQPVAQAVAETVLRAMLERHATVGDAMQQARIDLLGQRSLVGLYYTPYAWADLRFSALADQVAA